jgi:endonuclease YncB( thermonuclease family)
MQHWLLVAGAWLCWLPAASGDERDFSGTVRRIFDGDSFLVRPAQARDKSLDIDVRLQDIDAPEKSQPYGNAARAALVEIIADRDVFVDVIDTDRYGRKIVRVFREPDRLDVIKAMVRDGHVWVYRRKVHDASLVDLEDAAREARRGLWALPEEELMPPWQYRYLRRKNKKTTSVLFLTGQRSWHLERAQSGDSHESISPVTRGIGIPPRAVSGGEARAGWPIVVPQPIEVAGHLQR